MKYFEEIAENIFAFLLWDDSWNSFNNCYVVLEKDGVTLVDSGKEEHFPHLESSLNEIGISPRDINKFIATHGHRDHIGGCAQLHEAKKIIHPDDLALLPANAQIGFISDFEKTGDEFEWILLGHHTKGSVALFHRESKILFCGDHVCFFGHPLPAGKIVTSKETLDETVQTFLANWSQDQELREKENIDGFIDGLNTWLRFEPQLLCTGHGVIVQGDISGWVTEILDKIK